MGNTLRVLIVEDSEDDALLLVRQLKQGGYEPEHRRVDSREAMQAALEQAPWQIVITDHNMPGFSSTEALEVLNDSGLDVPFIIVSGSIGEDIAVEAMKAGAHDYIMKDNLARLLPAIERELREAKERFARRQAEEAIRHLAYHDPLTGLANRREFERQLESLLDDAKAHEKQHALCYLDLDQFKIVNDTCGHIAGDELLRQVSILLKQKLRDSDVLARLGGDEFGVLLENCPLEQALRIANELCEMVRDYRFVWKDKTFEVGVSIGVVAITRDSESATSILSGADVACYAAKDLGRNRVHVYQESDEELAQRHGEMYWVARITQAFQARRFEMYQQKIISLSSDDPDARHFELLLRLRDEQGGLILPSMFIPAAERYGLMPTLDRWVIRAAFPFVASFCRGRDACFAINLSGTSLNDNHFLDFIKDEIEKYDIRPGAVCFEITETAAVTNLSRAVHFMTELKSLGCRFSLDDFGSGLSSFHYLKNLPVDFLKIDGSFVRDIVEDPVDHVMVEAINRVGQVMGIQTIAEFVENDEILAELRRIGVNYAQGYGIARPAPLEAVMSH